MKSPQFVMWIVTQDDMVQPKMVVQLQELNEGYGIVVEKESGKPAIESPPPELTRMRQSTDTGSPDMLAEPDFGPHFSASVDEDLAEAR